MKTLLCKLNWRLIVIHVLASWLFLLAFREFAILHDYDFQYVYHPNLTGPIDNDRVTNDMYFGAFISAAALLTSFALSLMLAIKNKWFWLNSLLTFLIALFSTPLIVRTNLGYYVSLLLIPFPAGLWDFVAIGSLFLIPGLLLFFSKHIIKFISVGKLTEVQTTI